MLLLGWSKPLSTKAVAALGTTLSIIKVVIKGVEYELLQGYYIADSGLIKRFQ
jgi:hypothetical protein